MTLFNPATNSQAYLKAAIHGFAGSGKSTTATNIAGGLICYLRKKNIHDADKPVYFLDTETGADFVKPLFDKQNIELRVAKTRSFEDLLIAIDEAEQNGSLLIIDSITHFWTDLTTSYSEIKKQRCKKYGKQFKGLEFLDWSILKDQWRKFTDKFINSKLHIIICGRAGYEYDFFENDNGKKELEKTGVKMKAEGETGYEASILVYMERKQSFEGENLIQYRTATILKDRTRTIDGQTFKNPTFKDFLPHIQFLNLGGEHIGVDSTRTSEDLFIEERGGKDYDKLRQLKAIALEEIDGLLATSFSTSMADKQKKAALLENIFGTVSDTAIRAMNYEELDVARDQLWRELKGTGYYQDTTPSEERQQSLDVSLPGEKSHEDN